MGKGRAALTYLPAVDILVTITGGAHSVEALKAVANKVATMQEESTPDGTYAGVKCLMSNPYSTCVWDIALASGVYTLTFVSEENFETSAQGRAALSTRRPITFNITDASDGCTVRSLLASVNFVEKLEDKVAKTGVGATGDATYTSISLKGFTPFESFVWTVTKLDDAYTASPQ